MSDDAAAPPVDRDAGAPRFDAALWHIPVRVRLRARLVGTAVVCGRTGCGEPIATWRRSGEGWSCWLRPGFVALAHWMKKRDEGVLACRFTSAGRRGAPAAPEIELGKGPLGRVPYALVSTDFRHLENKDAELAIVQCPRCGRGSSGWQWVDLTEHPSAVLQ